MASPLATVWRALPAASKTAGAVAVGLAIEYALRAAANRGLVRFTAPPRPSARGVTRTVVTEILIIERHQRRS